MKAERTFTSDMLAMRESEVEAMRRYIRELEERERLQEALIESLRDDVLARRDG